MPDPKAELLVTVSKQGVTPSFKSRPGAVPGRAGWRRWLAGLLATLLLQVAGAALSQDAAKPVATPIAASSDVGQDEQIRLRIRSLLDNMTGLEAPIVQVRSGIVNLQGVAAEQAVIEQARKLAARVEGVVEVENRIKLSNEVGTRVSPVLTRMNERLQQLLAGLPVLLLGLILLASFAVLAWWLGRPRQLWARVAPNPFIGQLLRQLVTVLTGLAGAVIALDIIGAGGLLSTLLGTAGVAGLALGFALRDTVENYVASVMLSLRQPFSPGDLVDVEGQVGHVIRMTSRATVLLSLDGNHVSIPNSAVFKGVIVNFSRDPQRRFAFTIDLQASGSLRQAVQVVERRLVGLPFVLASPPPTVLIDHVDAVRSTLAITGWINQLQDDFGKSRSEAIRLTRQSLREAGQVLSQQDSTLVLEHADSIVPRSPTGAERAGDGTPVTSAREDRQPVPTAPDQLGREKALSESQAGAAENLLSDKPSSRLE